MIAKYIDTCIPHSKSTDFKISYFMCIFNIISQAVPKKFSILCTNYFVQHMLTIFLLLIADMNQVQLKKIRLNRKYVCM